METLENLKRKKRKTKNDIWLIYAFENVLTLKEIFDTNNLDYKALSVKSEIAKFKESWIYTFKILQINPIEIDGLFNELFNLNIISNPKKR